MSTVLITGAAGFLGSHLTEWHLRRGDRVIGLDDLSTGDLDNLAHLQGDQLHLRISDATDPDSYRNLHPKPSLIYNLASPASPVDFTRDPEHTLRASALATLHSTEYAIECGARYLLASTSEVYGDPTQHPQTESYRGNVALTGPRAVYDESKRYAEVVVNSRANRGLDAVITRTFNTYGERMRMDDGRLIPELVARALDGQPLIVHGDGTQTRSLCYVDDMIEGLTLAALSGVFGTYNLGRPVEQTVLSVAETVRRLTGGRSPISFAPRPPNDPTRRCPDITRAREVLGWNPSVDLEEGLSHTIRDATTKLTR